MEINHRRCVTCRTVAHRDQFWRVVRLSETGAVVLDQGMGRSAYLCPTQDCLAMAQKKKRLERSLRIAVPPEIYYSLWTRLENSTR